MVDGGGSRVVANANKAVLGDITNICGKRKLSLDLEKDVARDARFEEQLAVESRAFMKRKDKNDGTTKSFIDCKGKGILSFDSKQQAHPVASDTKGNFVQRNMLSDFFSLQESRDSVAQGFTEVDKSGQGCIPFGSLSTQYNKSSETDSEEDCLEDDDTESADSMRYCFHVKNDDGKSTTSKCTGLDFTALKENKVYSGDGISNVPLAKSAVLEFMNPSGSFDIKRNDGAYAFNSVPSCSENNMSEKSCKCSFCLKAAYIWADLYYQDTRGRLAALKKSKRLARSLEGRSCSNNYSIKDTRQGSKRSAELEFELTQQWRSLFLCTENALVRETSQLHANFLRLKELREKCKRDLEKISMVPSEK